MEADREAEKMAEPTQSISKPKSRQKYEILRTLGQGSFAEVKEAVHLLSGEKIAIKILEKARLRSEDDQDRIRRETNILSKVHHPNIIQLYEHIETDNYFYFVMEFAERGEMSYYIEKKQRLTETEACKFFQQLISAISYLHKLGCAHRDIKPSNILIDYNKDIKLIDFGLGNVYDENEKLKTACGSPCYAAPEIISNEAYDPVMVDIWSSGITLFAMLCGFLPFDDESKTQLYEKIIACQFKIPRHVSHSAADLLSKILVRKVSDRLTIEQIKAHPWFNLHKPTAFSDGLYFSNKKVPLDKGLCVLAAHKLGVNVEAISKMVSENERNKYTMLYYLLKKKSERGELDAKKELREIDEKARAAFQSENEKTKEIRYRPATTAGENHLKTQKNADTQAGSGIDPESTHARITGRKTINEPQVLVSQQQEPKEKPSEGIVSGSTKTKKILSMDASKPKEANSFISQAIDPRKQTSVQHSDSLPKKLVAVAEGFEPRGSTGAQKFGVGNPVKVLKNDEERASIERKQLVNNLKIIDRTEAPIPTPSFVPGSIFATLTGGLQSLHKPSRSEGKRRLKGDTKSRATKDGGEGGSMPKPEPSNVPTGVKPQSIKSVLRNLVRKKGSPNRKAKKAKGPEDRKGVGGSLPKQLALVSPAMPGSQPRKLQKLFSRKNMSLSVETRKLEAASLTGSAVK
jgi:serine/threonine protein kinase